MQETKQVINTEQQRADAALVGETVMAQTSTATTQGMTMATTGVADAMLEEASAEAVEHEVQIDQGDDAGTDVDASEARLEPQEEEKGSTSPARARWAHLNESDRKQFILSTFAYGDKDLLVKSQEVCKDPALLANRIDEQTIISLYRQLEAQWATGPNPPLEQVLSLETLLNAEAVMKYLDDRVKDGFIYRLETEIRKYGEEVVRSDIYSTKLRTPEYAIEIRVMNPSELLLAMLCFTYTHYCLPIAVTRQSIIDTYDILPILDWDQDVYPVLVEMGATKEDAERIKAENAQVQSEAEVAAETNANDAVVKQDEAETEVQSESPEDYTTPDYSGQSLPVGTVYDVNQGGLVQLPETMHATDRFIEDSTGVSVRIYVDAEEQDLEVYWDSRLGKILL